MEEGNGLGIVMMSFCGGIEEEKALHRTYDELLVIYLYVKSPS
jgi:hypothetical protein